MTFKFFYNVPKQVHFFRGGSRGPRRAEVFNRLTRQQFRRRLMSGTAVSNAKSWDALDRKRMQRDSVVEHRRLNVARMPAAVIRQKLKRGPPHKGDDKYLLRP
ncbi:hypothetical protein, unlikely [Trypanosoma brucei gambiense DAL972]|uniref:Uncharacterized protein n=2 Tax=Trypanosoma brucei TaxID=5691 RepID=C9ZVU1_TRYB9|nr:hypothetical protein, unlikely [Trypanosoma brucei gambiense DAL972]RHW70803.1 hypothetical protein DPX39_080051200 [Trypanosoma brucei equiperdum]CBH13529.1 hypothetical protein, unlikely [Trypanosoma brucei gambiense DAL972]|eukprot:XP_011775806.1 hypothetical protein, unlikely [Trypanosoma brucei gambiense DAL972]